MVGLVLALALGVVAPVPALAAKPVGFGASGVITDVSQGDIFPAGNSGRFVVQSREMVGNISGDISGDFVLTYKANVVIQDQSGNLHGKLTVTGEDGAWTVNVNGKSNPLEFVWVDHYGFLPKLSISGHWTFNSGAKGNGDFEAWLIFIPDAHGHIVDIIGSAFEMTSQWKP